MPNIRIITPNESDAAVLTAAPALVATLPQTNLQDQARERVARTTGLTAQDIKGVLPSSKWVSALALTRHNLTSVATWRLRLYSDAAWTTLVYDSTAVPAVAAKSLGDLEWGIDPLGASVFTGWAHAFSCMWFAPVIARSFIVTLADGANPAGYMEASRLFLGRYLDSLYNFEWGLRLAWEEDTTQERTDGGTLRSDGVEPNRRMSFRLAWLSPTDRPKFLEWARRDGLRNDFFASGHPTYGGALERDHAMSGKLAETPVFAQTRSGDFDGEFVIKES